MTTWRRFDHEEEAMDVGLAVAGVLCVGLALGHETLGMVWVLPGVKEDRLAKTPFGPSRLTAATIHATWHIVTVFVLSLAVLLLMLAADVDVDARRLMLRVFSVMWVGVTLVATGSALRRTRKLRHLARLPVPVLFAVVAVLLWTSST
jgi:hypothetical protein